MKGLQKLSPRAGIGVGMGTWTVKEHEGTFWSNRNIINFYYGGVYIDVYVCQHSSNCIFKVSVFNCM